MQESSLKRSDQTLLASSSQQSKKEVLWNVQQPGDPYDIKRSMIAKLPGGKPFMGQQLQIVCLFQAAQIERLSDFLQTYKVKFKDLERVELDRHSYEIQIKELIQKISEMDQLTKDNEKLKEFVKKQGIEIQALQQSFRENITNEQFNSVYEKALEKISGLTQDNKELVMKNQRLINDFNSLRSKFEALEKTKAKQLEEMRLKINQMSINSSASMQNRNEHSFNLFKIQVQGQLAKLQTVIRRLQDNNQNKNREISQLRLQNQSLLRNERSLQARQSSLFQIQSLKLAYEQKISSLNLQNQQLNQKMDVLRRQNVNHQQNLFSVQLKWKDSESKLKNREEEMGKLNELLRTMDKKSWNEDSESKSVELFKSKNQQLQQQIIRLRLQLQSSQEKPAFNQDSFKLLQESNNRYQMLERENEELRRGVLENNELKRQIAYLQTERAVLSQQLQRMHGQLGSRTVEQSRLQAMSVQNKILNDRMNEVERVWQSKYESQMLKIKTEFENRLNQYVLQNDNESRQKAVALSRELEQYKQLLKYKTSEEQKQSTSSLQLQSRLKQISTDDYMKIQRYESLLSALKQENQELNLKTQQFNELQLKIYNFQRKQNTLETQHQHLTTLLSNKEQEILGLKSKILQNEQAYNRSLDQLNRKTAQLTHSNLLLSNEKEQLSRKISYLMSSNSQIGKQTVSEISRLTVLNKNLQEEKIQGDIKIKQLAMNVEYYQQNIEETIREKEELKKILIQLEGSNKTIVNESQAYLKVIQLENQSLKRENERLKITVSKHEMTISKAGSTYDQYMALISKENEELKRLIKERQTSGQQNLKQLQHYRTNYQLKCEEVSAMERNYRKAAQETENLRRYLKQYENNVNNKFNGQLKKQESSFEQIVQNINRENEQQKRKFIDLQNRYTQLNNQFEKLTFTLKNNSQELQRSRAQLSQKQSIISRFDSDITKAITHYQGSMTNLQRNNEELLFKVNQKDKQLRLRQEQYHRLEANYRILNQQLQQSKRKYSELQFAVGQKMQGQVAAKFNNYQRGISQLSKQNQQLKKNVSNLSNEFNKKVFQMNALAGENEGLRRRISQYDSSIKIYQEEMGKKISNLQLNLQTLTSQNQDLKKRLQEGADFTRKINLESGDKVSNLTRELQRLHSQLAFYEKDNNELKRKLGQLEHLKRIVTELQNKLAITSQELERTNGNLRVKFDEYNKLELKSRNLLLDLESARKHQIEMESNYNITFQQDVVRKYNNYEQTIADLSRKLNELDGVNKSLASELDRYKNNLRIKGDQSSQQLASHQLLANEYQELKRRAAQADTASQQAIFNLKRQNQEFKRRFQEYDVGIRKLGEEVNKKTAEYQNRIAILKQQNQRLVLSTRQYESVLNQRGEVDLKNKFAYQSALNNLGRQNQDLRRKLHQLNETSKKLPEYEQKTYRVIQQNQQLQQLLRVKTDELNNADAQLRRFNQQVDQLKRDIFQLQKNLTNKYEQEVSMKTNNFEQNMTVLSKEREELYRKKTDYETKITMLTNQIERLNQLVTARTEELQRALTEAENLRQISQRKLMSNENQLNTLQSNYIKISNESETQRRYLQQYEINTQKMQGEFERLQHIIDELKKERQNLFDKNAILSDQIERLSQQSKDLESQARDATLRLSNESSLQKRISQHLALMVVLFAEIETLRKRVSDKERQVEDVRRSSLSPHMLKH